MVVPYERVETPHDGRGVKLFKWSNLGVTDGAPDTGQPVVVAAYNDKTVQIQGSTFGSGITIQGNCDPSGNASWDTLNDPQGNPLLTIQSEKLENILEHCYLVRPVATIGTSGITVWLLLASVS